ncbi:glycosyltransferase family 4 protein [Marinivivus vitaminiproducens]|uniref:glycosyltransferase family 4 protein n=1 Tax=Marinivivus vitaminiproducens TaxID=3035935 RepID=UPI00279A014E|nr:glycosyltransferase family 4 protein [Geminicoccaceae bacterium SCSIO 64248]
MSTSAPPPPSRPRVFFVGVLPPPLTGMTAVSRAVLDELGRACAVVSLSVTRPARLAGRTWSLYKQAALLPHYLRVAARARTGDLVYGALSVGGGLFGDCALALAARLRGARLVLHHHSFFGIGAYDRRLALLIRLAGPDVRHVLLGQDMRRTFHRLYGPRHAVVVGNDVWTRAALPAAEQPRAALRTVGYLSNINRAKGIDLALDCFRRVAERAPETRFLIAGPVADAEDQAGIDEFVAEDPDWRSHAGAVYGDAKAAFFDAIDLFVFPTRFAGEADPLVVHEAAGQGLPVLATRRGCVPERVASPDDLAPDEEAFPAWAAERIVGWIRDPAAFSAASRDVLARRAERLEHMRRERADFLDLFAGASAGAATPQSRSDAAASAAT